MIDFLCNVCGARCSAKTIDREIPSCRKCGSNVRFRWIVHALSMELFGKSLPLKKFPKRKDIRGFGMSDPGEIGYPLSKCLDYTNTFYDAEPRFDIQSPPVSTAYDFITTSEVFEHVPPPIQKAFNNLARLLKPDGIVIFTTPWEMEGDTIEHYPNLYDWQIVKLQSGYLVVNRTASGQLETFEKPEFHRGPGSVLEMRIFSKSGLLANCEAAGFAVTMAEDYPAYGIVWEKWSRGMILRKQ